MRMMIKCLSALCSINIAQYSQSMAVYNRLRLDPIPEDSEICSPVVGFPCKRVCRRKENEKEVDIPTLQFTKSFLELLISPTSSTSRSKVVQEDVEEKTCSLKEAYCSIAARIRF